MLRPGAENFVQRGAEAEAAPVITATASRCIELIPACVKVEAASNNWLILYQPNATSTPIDPGMMGMVPRTTHGTNGTGGARLRDQIDL